MGANALPKRQVNAGTQYRKALPTAPGRFRLGADGMPWSLNPYPTGYVESNEVEDGEDHHVLEETPRARVVDDRERVRVTEIGSLATALMTVDNGFEDQWWFNGPRYFNVAGDLISPSDMMATRDGKLGWAVAQNQRQSIGETAYPMRRETIRSQNWGQSPESSMIDIVSPMSGSVSSGSIPPALRRHVTTGSDELHLFYG